MSRALLSIFEEAFRHVLRVILLAILLLLVARALWKLLNGVIEAAGGTRSRGRGAAPAVRLVQDPVCGTYVAPRTGLSVTAGGSTHYFCSEQCRAKFTARS